MRTRNYYDDGWDWDIEFYFCDGTDGSDYSWMIDNNYWQFQCGGRSANDADILAAQYVTDNKNSWPSCTNFRYQPSTFHFAWPQIQSHDVPGFQYALLQPNLANQLDAIWADTNITILNPQNRVYSSPFREDAINPGAPNSRHIYGDAADINSTAATWQPLRFKIFEDMTLVPCAEPSKYGTGHLHIDYRAAPNELYDQRWSGGCPNTAAAGNWNLP